jgi:hypothetical protein
MDCRYELLVQHMDPLWRVTASDHGRRMPEYCRQYPSLEEAVAYAKGRGLELLAIGEHARIVLAEAGGNTELWSTIGDALL